MRALDGGDRLGVGAFGTRVRRVRLRIDLGPAHGGSGRGDPVDFRRDPPRGASRRCGDRRDLRRFPLGHRVRFVQDDVAIAEPAGELAANLRHQFGYRGRRDVAEGGRGGGRRHESRPHGACEQGAAARPGQAELVAARGDVIARELTVPEVSVSRGRVAVTLARDGT